MLRVIWKVIKKGALVVLALVTLFIVYEVFTFPRVSDLQTKNPETTSMIETRLKEAREEGREPRRVQQWVPLSRISVNLQRAVLAGEDTNFVAHNGFDYEAIQKAWEAGQKEAEREAKQEGEEDTAWLPDLSRFRRGADLLPQARRQPLPAGGGLPRRDDPLAAQRLQPAEEPPPRPAPPARPY